MRVNIRRRVTHPHGVEVDQEVDLSASGSYAPDVAVDLVTRALELWRWLLGDEEDAEP